MKVEKNIILGIIILFIFFLFMNYTFLVEQMVISKKEVLFIELAIAVLGIICFLISVHICNKKEFKPEKAFLYIVPLFCIVFFIAMPAGRGHDEYYHYARAYEISEGKLISDIDNGKAMADLPQNTMDIIVEREKMIFKYIDNFSLLNKKIDENVRMSYNITSAAPYCFVQYLPQALGLAIGRLFTSVPLIIAYFGKLFNIIICVLLMYFAIKNIPFGKNILFAVSMIPITIEGFTTFSADGITISLACFFRLSLIIASVL